MTGKALLLTPSRGLGGGIERYVQTVERAFATQGVEYARIDLDCAGPASHARMLGEARKQLRSAGEPMRLVLAHRTLLAGAYLLARDRMANGISLICHGADVWGARHRARWQVERRLLRRPDVRVIAASSFTAGALLDHCQAAVLPPGLSLDWFESLVSASEAKIGRGPGIRLVTAFRLAEWNDKGLPELLAAVASLGRPDVSVSVCGSGSPPTGLLQLLRQYPRCTLHRGLTDRGLAWQFATADLFILATRTRSGRYPSGEGFGLVLLEAQVAGTPVVGPAYGGSHDAYVDGVTGATPVDESSESLARVLDNLLRDPARLAQMRTQAAQWARESFAPERYARLVVDRLL